MNCANNFVIEHQDKYYVVPCGKCLACLSNKRNDWSFRLEQEMKAAKGAAFITLTYHPKFVPETGLDKEHVQLFMKRLRKRSGKKLRYYLVGEYGSKKGRPHYHIILFNYEEKDQSYVRNSWGLYDRKTKTTTPYGIVHFGKVNAASIRYCTKYVIQRSAYPPGMAKPFALMSRAYGLGANYLTDKMIAWHRDGLRNFTRINGEKGRLPRYYKDKIWWVAESKNKEYFIGKFQQPLRMEISRIAIDQVKAAQETNYRILKEAGYKPEKIMAEMRNAVMSRVMKKVAFTQTF